MIMPSCSIKQCIARKNKNQQKLTFHRIPKNEIMKKKWLEIIGSENIKPTLKTRYVCSMHFDETSFNRTLGVIRLRDDAVPSSSLLSQYTESTLELTLNSQPSASVMISDPHTLTEIGKLVNQERQENVASKQLSQHTKSTLELTLNSQPSASVMVSDPHASTEIDKLVEQERQENVASKQILLQKNEKIDDLTQKCENLRKKVKRLSEKVRRRDKKIALLTQIMKDLQKRNLLKSEEIVILEECAEPEDFPKRRMAKCRGIPLENTHVRSYNSLAS